MTDDAALHIRYLFPQDLWSQMTLLMYSGDEYAFPQSIHRWEGEAGGREPRVQIPAHGSGVLFWMFPAFLWSHRDMQRGPGTRLCNQLNKTKIILSMSSGHPCPPSKRSNNAQENSFFHWYYFLIYFLPHWKQTKLSFCLCTTQKRIINLPR